MSQLAKRKTFSLRQQWRVFDKQNSSAKSYLELCGRMIEVGEFLLAHDVAKDGLGKHKHHRLLSQKAAHALCKAGSPMMATKILEGLVTSGVRDVETQSLLASAYKDLCEYSTNPENKSHYAELAIYRYKEAFVAQLQEAEKGIDNLESQYYPCINVAFMHFVSHNLPKAHKYANFAREICRTLRQRGDGSYWVLATEAEASLLLGEINEAIQAYTTAVNLDDAQPSHIASTRKQALQISSLYSDSTIREQISAAFPVLGIVACSGHVIDNADSSRRFPPEAEKIAKQRIEEKLEQIGANCGYSSAACGTDILFLETMIERGGETHIFLPFAKDEFIETSVRRSGGDWVSRLENVLDHATSVHYVTHEGYYGDDSLFSFCNQVMIGFAAMRGRGLDEDPQLLVFWDGKPGSVGGTGELVNSWKSVFNEPEVIDANEVLTDLPGLKTGRVIESPAPVDISKDGFGDALQPIRSVKTMIFADAAGFSQITEDLTSQFVEAFHGGVAQMIDKLPQPPSFVNTWGDSFFAVFEDLESALKLALGMRDYFTDGKWSEWLPNGNMDVRISMHAGPAYEEFDPILKKRNFFGSHVNQAARIEPIVLPGSVFVSETVAALISFGYEEYDFEYAGNIDLAKNYGTYPVYILQRKGYSDKLIS